MSVLGFKNQHHCTLAKPLGAPKLGPGNIGPANCLETDTTDPVPGSKDIWSAAEGSEYDSLYDPRPQPEYGIVYSQAVRSEGILLQMGNKTPTTSSCDNIIVVPPNRPTQNGHAWDSAFKRRQD